MSAEHARAYLDASALVKLVVPEPESPALAGALTGLREAVTSVVGAVEVRRAMIAAGAIEPKLISRATDLLARTVLVSVTDEIREIAEALPEPRLRTLAAIHIATALALGPTIVAFVVYDRKLGDAARDAGLPALTPGR
jgi:predicted nucleic acid-binding protein